MYLSHAVVVVSMRHKKSCLDVAAIGILQLATKEPVQLPVVVVVDCVVEGDDNHLRDLVLWQSPRYLLAGGGTEAVWEPAGNKVQNVNRVRDLISLAAAEVTFSCPVGIIPRVAESLVTPVTAVLNLVTEQFPGNYSKQ